MRFGSSIKNNRIVIIGHSMVFKCKLTDREDIERAVGKISISRQTNSTSERHRVWSVEGLKTQFDRSNGESVPTECTLVYRAGEVNCTIEDVAEKFKEMIQ